MIALIRLRDRPGEKFIAETYEVEAGLIHATGSWERWIGPVTGYHQTPRRRYVWPIQRLREIRWLNAGESR